jgi:hypothetical protein
MQMRKFVMVIAIAVMSGLAFSPSAHALVDKDKDGTKDSKDLCPNTDLSVEEAVIDSCTPSLPNELDEEGCSTQQRIDNCFVEVQTRDELELCLLALVQEEIDDGDLVLSNKEAKKLDKCIHKQRLPE